MGTRSIVSFKNRGQLMCKVYQQFDGYPDGVGMQLVNFLKSKPLVNGIGQDNNVFNGAGCLVAQYIKEHKYKAGGLYIQPIGDSKEEFNYIVDIEEVIWNEPDSGSIKIGCLEISKNLYSIDEFEKKINQYSGE